MKASLARRLKRLEARHPPRRVRVVWWDRSQPRPVVEAAPGEQVYYVSWLGGEDPAS
jgi:hypothetical protein